MNEGLIFVVIIVATILEGIIGALLVVPVLASVVVIAGYVQRRVLGLPPFEDDGSMQFVAPPEKIKPVRRGIRRINNRLDEEPASDSPKPASASSASSNSKTNPARKKTKE
jgi:hypothetical protein